MWAPQAPSPKIIIKCIVEFHFFSKPKHAGICDEVKRVELQMRDDTNFFDVLWGQTIKLIQVVPTSEFHKY